MLNIIVPMSGPMPFFDENEYPFPKPLVEINGITMIEYLIRNLRECGDDIHLFFMVRQDYCRKFHIDDTIRLLAPEPCRIVPVALNTNGALCTCLLAIDHIDNDQPLLIVNFDQYFSNNFNQYVRQLYTPPYQGGCLVFPSVHPRWSFVRTEGETIVEAAEKRPLTRQAIAGAYGFLQGSDFVSAAKQVLLKDADHNGIFYLSSTINEAILLDKRLRAVAVSAVDYHSFYSPQKIREFSESYR